MTETKISIPRKSRIIDAAEELFGRYGIEGVSLREICRASGTKNVTAAQYYFGSKEELINGVVLVRRPLIDQYRLSLFVKRGLTLKDSDTADLVQILHRGLFDHVNGNGIRAFAAFLSALLTFDRFPRIFWKNRAETGSFTELLCTELRTRMLHVPDLEWEFRLFEMGRMAAGAIAQYDQMCDVLRMSEAEFLDALCRMVVGALEAPASSVKSEMTLD